MSSPAVAEPPAPDHDDPAPGRPVERIGAEHQRATAADAARTLAAGARVAMLATLTDRPEGYPFGSIVSFALDPAGNPLFVISAMAEHTRNATRDARASLLVTEPAPEHDPLDGGRVTLVGDLERVPDADQAAATALVVDAVPAVGRYAHFGDFSCWRLTVAAVRWVGGFGAMSWIDADGYAAATADVVLAARRGVIEHMNDDHADACLAIAQRTLGRDDVIGVTMVGVDRFGCDYHVVTSGPADVHLRVPFIGEVTEVGEVRRQLVEQTRAARAIG